ncbi:hypothetical protein [Phaeobacter sp. J2-8]|uniref:COG4223 family protein n=1 Tax=Phaeobacter sp. J2-8 TaxID=2931394 RepID=UPI001FD120EF|nr:hypothetical protein [Phaeobacter sp. J2-8]MCJ7875048.1 hypothetical protein [Phaeobacter sp. J2-8]
MTKSRNSKETDNEASADLPDKAEDTVAAGADAPDTGTDDAGTEDTGTDGTGTDGTGADGAGADTVASDTPDEVTDNAVAAAESPESADKTADLDEDPQDDAETATVEDTPEELWATDVTPKEADILGGVSDATSDPTPPVPPVAAQQSESSSGFWPMALGGVVAAGVGFAAAWYVNMNDDLFEVETRSALNAQSGRIEALSGEMSAGAEAVTAQIAELSAEIAATQNTLASAQGDLTALGDRITNVESFAGDIAAVDDRLTELAKKPIADTVSREAIKAYEDELERLRASMEDQRQAIEDTIAAEKAKIEKIAEDATQMEERALEESRLAAARSAMTRILSALDTGDAYGAALAELAESVDMPMEALEAAAAEGVVTQSALREQFPDVARAALRAARNNTPAEESGGIGGVLEKMFEVRSVAPREGDGADAILSRAEAAVRDGDLARALDEIAALPDVAKAELSGWVSDAETRLAALGEAHEIAARLNQG